MKFRLPKSIGEHTHFTWGPVVAVHRIGPYAIVEYRRQIFEGSTSTGKYSDTETMFHPYVDGKDTNVGTYSLEMALLHAIASKQFGHCDAANSRVAFHAGKLLDLHIVEEKAEAGTPATGETTTS